MAKPLTDETLLSLRKRMLIHATQAGHREPEEIASEYVVRLLEGLHQSATISQAYIDILRLQSGRKGASSEENYKKRQALTMVASTEEQEKYYATQADHEPAISVDEAMDLDRVLSTIKCPKKAKVFALYREGYTQDEIAVKMKLTLGRINQIINRTCAELHEEVNSKAGRRIQRSQG